MKRKVSNKLALALFVLSVAAASMAAQESVAVVNGASFEPRFPVSPGCWASAFADFASVGVLDTSATVLPLPAMLGGVQLFVNGVAAPLNFVGGRQINFLVPKDTPAQRVSLRVAVSGQTTFEGTMDVWPVSPGLFSTNPGIATKPGAVLNQDSSINSQQNPARRGEVVQIFGAGADFIGLPDDGAAGPGDPLVLTESQTEITISVVPAPVQFSGLAPGFAGLWQINAVVPTEAFVRGLVTVQAKVRGVSSNQVSIWVAE